MKKPTFLFHPTHGAQLFDAEVENMKALHEEGWSDSPAKIPDPEPVTPPDWSVGNIKDGDIAVIPGVNNGKPVVLRVFTSTDTEPMDAGKKPSAASNPKK
jgi:hypothetical protein